MKRLLLFVLLSANVAYGQVWLDDTIGQIQTRIQHRHTELNQSKHKVDTMEALIDDYLLLSSRMAEKLDAAYSLIEWMEVMLDEDSSIFAGWEEYDVSIDSIPYCLKEHFKTIIAIVELKKLINRVDDKIKNISASTSDLTPEKQKTVIQTAIDPSVNEIDQKISEINKMSKSTLTPNQFRFYENLVKRYNNYSKYYK